MDSNSPYITACCTNVITPSSTVVLPDVVKFKRDGKVVGRLSATIDFKDLDPELHHNAIQLLQQMPVCLYLESSIISPPVKPSVPEPYHRVNQWPLAWKKIKKIIGLS